MEKSFDLIASPFIWGSFFSWIYASMNPVFDNGSHPKNINENVMMDLDFEGKSNVKTPKCEGYNDRVARPSNSNDAIKASDHNEPEDDVS